MISSKDGVESKLKEVQVRSVLGMPVSPYQQNKQKNCIGAVILVRGSDYEHGS